MLAAFFAVAVIGLGVLNVLALVLPHGPAAAPSSAVTLNGMVGVLRPALVLASVAGAGLGVAIIVTKRRQQAAAASSVLDEQATAASPAARPAPERTQILGQQFAALAARFAPGQEEVRLTEVQAMADLADDWEENRQSCVDVLCACLRQPYQPEPPSDAAEAGVPSRPRAPSYRDPRHHRASARRRAGVMAGP